MRAFVPPYLLRAIAERGAEGLRQKAWAALSDSEQTRGQRILMASIGAVAKEMGVGKVVKEGWKVVGITA